MSTIYSAVEELEQQLNHSFALVASARSELLALGSAPESMALTLLDMADDELSNTQFIQQLNQHCGPASVTP